MKMEKATDKETAMNGRNKHMTGAERIRAAMELKKPDRVPLMSQPSWGFVLKQIEGLDPVALWHNREGTYSRAFTQISQRFRFDGVLIPAVGLAPLDQDQVESVGVETDSLASGGPGGPPGGDDTTPGGSDGIPGGAPHSTGRIETPGGAPHSPGRIATPEIRFRNGDRCIYCLDDLPRYHHTVPPETTIEELDPDSVPETISFHPPSNRLRMWINEDTYGRVAELHQVRDLTGGKLSVHGSVYAPEDYLIDALGVEGCFMAMLSHPDKSREYLIRWAHALSKHVEEQIDAGADAINFSAPWTGQNFISLDMYTEVIMPAQALIVERCRERGVPVYCHTCGEIDDRLELIIDIGFNGLECLDPPPLGNVKLEDAVRRIGDRAFIKGNIDPVNMLMNGSPDEVREDARRRLEIGMKAKGFILSTACSIAPSTPARNLAALYEVVEEYGYY